MKTDLFKEAIAEADAIKKLAVQNAKEALNEAFDSKIKSMLAAKLQEEAEDLEEEYEEEYEEQDEAKKNTAFKNVVKSREDELDEVEEEEYEEQDEAKKHHKEPDADNEGGESDHDEDNMKEAEEDQADESFDIDAILAEMEDEDGNKDQDEAKKAKKEEEEEDEDEEKKKNPKEEEGGEEEGGEEADESVDLDALIAEMSKEEDPEEDGAMEEILVKDFTGSKTLRDRVNRAIQAAARMVGGDKGVLLGMIEPILRKAGVSDDKIKSIETLLRSASSGIAAGKGVDVNSLENSQLSEQVKELVNKVNETNLINAKLLYLNKVLRSHNLSENQKIKVVAAFDKATSVKEAKIVYESLTEALSLKTETKKTSLKESFGFASKPAGTSTKREIISEADQQVQRWQKLAGINKKR